MKKRIALILLSSILLTCGVVCADDMFPTKRLNILESGGSDGYPFGLQFPATTIEETTDDVWDVDFTTLNDSLYWRLDMANSPPTAAVDIGAQNFTTSGTINLDADSTNLSIGDTLTDFELYSDGTDGRIDTTGLLQIAPTSGLHVGGDGTGYDVKFYGTTSGVLLLWDESKDTLVVGDNLKGADVKFYGTASGKYMFWDGATSKLTVEGDLDVTGSAQLGDANTDIHSINTDQVAGTMLTALYDNTINGASGIHLIVTDDTEVAGEEQQYRSDGLDIDMTTAGIGANANSALKQISNIDLSLTSVELTDDAGKSRLLNLNVLNNYTGSSAGGPPTTVEQFGADFIITGNIGTSTTTSKMGIKAVLTGTADNSYVYRGSASGATANWFLHNDGGNNLLGGDNEKSKFGDTDTDLEIYSDGTNGLMEFDTALRLGDTSNYTQFADDGLQTMAGTARVLRSVDFEPDAIKKGGVGPTDSTEDGFPFHDYQAANDESVKVHWEIPHEYASAGEIHLHVEFFVDTAPGSTEYVTWGVEYQKLSIGDNWNFSSSTTVITNTALTSGTPANDKKMTNSGEIHLTTTGFEPMDVILIRIFRDANASETDALDNFGSPARVFNYHLMFLSDKQGQGT